METATVWGQVVAFGFLRDNLPREGFGDMPTSDFAPIPAVMSIVCSLKPRSICDVGVGCGKYGLLFREGLDLHDCEASEWQGSLFKGQLRLDGVEVYGNYLGPVQEAIYDHIYVGDIRHLVENLEEYDLFTLIDVLEHFETEEGVEVLNRLRAKARIGVLVVTPVEPCRQGKVAGNDHESHLSVWGCEEWEKLGGTRHMIVGTKWVALVEGRESGKASWLRQPGLRTRCRLAALRAADTLFPGRFRVPVI
jgi:hypothetical protein